METQGCKGTEAGSWIFVLALHSSGISQCRRGLRETGTTHSGRAGGLGSKSLSLFFAFSSQWLHLSFVKQSSATLVVTRWKLCGVGWKKACSPWSRGLSCCLSLCPSLQLLTSVRYSPSILPQFPVSAVAHRSPSFSGIILLCPMHTPPHSPLCLQICSGSLFAPTPAFPLMPLDLPLCFQGQSLTEQLRPLASRCLNSLKTQKSARS